MAIVEQMLRWFFHATLSILAFFLTDLWLEATKRVAGDTRIWFKTRLVRANRKAAAKDEQDDRAEAIATRGWRDDDERESRLNEEFGALLAGQVLIKESLNRFIPESI